MSENENEHEETLDPEDWSEIRRLGHQMVDDMIDYLARLRERPVWQPVPEEVKRRLRENLPEEPQGLARVYRDFLDNVLPYPTGNLHPRFWGWVKGTGTAEGMLAEMLAAGMNCNVSGFDDAATLVERQVLDWLKQMLGYPTEASGLLVSGASMANLVGLAVARNTKAPQDVRADGLWGGPQKLTLYGSQETHASIDKAVELLGLGRSALRRLPVNERFEIDLAALAASIEQDRRAGDRPICVIGNAGTVNTGAIDDLNALADLCERQGLWLHVDGAFGVWATLASEASPFLRALSRADSVAFDLHKWLFVPYEAGCCLIRSAESHRRTFSIETDYLPTVERGPSASGFSFADLGPQLSRGFRALKVWMSIKAHGRRRLARLIDQNIAQARYLARRISASRWFEVAAPVSMNIVCFRYINAALGDEDVDRLNAELLYTLQEEGVVVPSQTRIHGRSCLRVAITNHRSQREDFDRFVEAAQRHAARISNKL